MMIINPYRFSAAATAIANWFLDETSGTVAVDQIDSPTQDGTYVSVTVGATDGPFGDDVAPLLDAVNDLVDIYSTTFRDAVDVSEFVVSLWARMDALWDDDLTQRMLTIRADASNTIYLLKAGQGPDPEFMRGRYVAGGVSKEINYSAHGSPKGWFHLALRVSIDEDTMKFYVTGVQVGSTLVGLGTWVGDIGNTTTVIGALNTSATQPFNGSIAHVRVDPLLSVLDTIALADRTSGYTVTFFTMQVDQPADPFDLDHWTNEGTERDTSIIPTGAVRCIAANTDFMFIDDDADFTPASGTVFTIYTWVRFTTAATQNIMGKGTADTASGLEWKLSIDATPNLIFSVGNGSSVVMASVSAAINTLYFVKCQYDVDGDLISIELDDGGSPVTAVPGGTPNDTASVVALGRLGDVTGNDFDGYIGPTYFIKSTAPSSSNDADAFASGTPRLYSDLSSSLQTLITRPYDWPVTTAV